MRVVNVCKEREREVVCVSNAFFSWGMHRYIRLVCRLCITKKALRRRRRACWLYLYSPLISSPSPFSVHPSYNTFLYTSSTLTDSLHFHLLSIAKSSLFTFLHISSFTVLSSFFSLWPYFDPWLVLFPSLLLSPTTICFNHPLLVSISPTLWRKAQMRH